MAAAHKDYESGIIAWRGGGGHHTDMILASILRRIYARNVTKVVGLPEVAKLEIESVACF